MLSSRQGLKPNSSIDLVGTTEVVPFHRATCAEFFRKGGAFRKVWIDALRKIAIDIKFRPVLGRLEFCAGSSFLCEEDNDSDANEQCGCSEHLCYRERFVYFFAAGNR